MTKPETDPTSSDVAMLSWQKHQWTRSASHLPIDQAEDLEYPMYNATLYHTFKTGKKVLVKYQ